MSRKIFITGATGNVGESILEELCKKNDPNLQIVAAIRSREDQDKLSSFENISFLEADFLEASSFESALTGIVALFLIRPPQIADTEPFKQILQIAQQKQVQHIVFLSVQGAESNPKIPHYKIEQLIQESGISYTFLRPAYFMQNFLGNLKADVIHRHQIFLPAANARFTLIDVRDIGIIGTKVLRNPEAYQNQGLSLTNEEQLSFGEMAEIFSEELSYKVQHISPNLLHFVWRKWREGVPFVFIGVMVMLHYLPRFSPPPPTTDTFEQITGKKARSFRAFVNDFRVEWEVQT